MDKAKGKANGKAKRAQQEPPFEGMEMGLGAVARMMQQSGLLHTMQVGACLRAGRRQDARELAARIAAVRGEQWTAEGVLRELGG